MSITYVYTCMSKAQKYNSDIIEKVYAKYIMKFIYILWNIFINPK